MLYFWLDIDECASQPCKYQGTCVDGVNGYTCICAPGYTGVECGIGEKSIFWKASNVL